MKIRQGRRNGHNLYVQFEDEPSDDDISIGYIVDPDIARIIVHELGGCEDLSQRLHA